VFQKYKSGGGGDGSEAKPVPSFTKALNAFETMRVYAHDVNKIYQANIDRIESLLFSMKRKGATTQMKISEVLKKK
jgi:hypothetical protein